MNRILARLSSKPRLRLVGSLIALAGVVAIAVVNGAAPTNALAFAFDATSAILAVVLGWCLTEVAVAARRHEAAVDAGFRFAVLGALLGDLLGVSMYGAASSVEAGALGMNTVTGIGIALPVATAVVAIPAFVLLWPLATLWARIVQVVARHSWVDGSAGHREPDSAMHS